MNPIKTTWFSVTGNKSLNRPHESIKQFLKLSGINYLETSQTRKHENSLKHSCYSNISWLLQQSSSSHTKMQRQSSIIQPNPLCSRTVNKNVAKKFAQVLDQHFPYLNMFHKVFNRNNAKVLLHTKCRKYY